MKKSKIFFFFKSEKNIWYEKILFCSAFFIWIVIKSNWCNVKSKKILKKMKKWDFVPLPNRLPNGTPKNNIIKKGLGINDLAADRGVICQNLS